MITTRMTNKMTEALTTMSGTKVYVSKITNIGNLENGYKILVVDKNFNCSDIKVIARGDDIIGQTTYLKNIADLDLRDAQAVGQFIFDNSEELDTQLVTEKMNARKVFNILYMRIMEEKIENGYYVLSKETFKEIIEGCGWKPIHFQKILLQAGMLKVSSGRIYDYNIKNADGNNEWLLLIDEEALKEEGGEN